MTRPWETLATVATREGALELRRRGDEFLIVIDGRVLMTSAARRSEEALATLACQRLAGRRAPRVLVGGLGMGYTLRAALDALPAGAHVVVAELSPEVAEWCRGPLAPLTGSALADRRVAVEIVDVAELIARAPAGSYDAILLDLYEGPHAATQRREDPFYGPAALARTHAALAPGGVFAVWSEEADAPFLRRFAAAGFAASTHRAGKGGRSHVVYLGVRSDVSAKAPARPAPDRAARSPRRRPPRA
jgi:spermidine synthase